MLIDRPREVNVCPQIAQISQMAMGEDLKAEGLWFLWEVRPLHTYVADGSLSRETIDIPRQKGGFYGPWFGEG